MKRAHEGESTEDPKKRRVVEESWVSLCLQQDGFHSIVNSGLLTGGDSLRLFYALEKIVRKLAYDESAHAKKRKAVPLVSTLQEVKCSFCRCQFEPTFWQEIGAMFGALPTLPCVALLTDKATAVLAKMRAGPSEAVCMERLDLKSCQANTPEVIDPILLSILQRLTVPETRHLCLSSFQRANLINLMADLAQYAELLPVIVQAVLNILPADTGIVSTSDLVSSCLELLSRIALTTEEGLEELSRLLLSIHVSSSQWLSMAKSDNQQQIGPGTRAFPEAFLELIKQTKSGLLGSMDVSRSARFRAFLSVTSHMAGNALVEIARLTRIDKLELLETFRQWGLGDLQEEASATELLLWEAMIWRRRVLSGAVVNEHLGKDFLKFQEAVDTHVQTLRKSEGHKLLPTQDAATLVVAATSLGWSLTPTKPQFSQRAGLFLDLTYAEESRTFWTAAVISVLKLNDVKFLFKEIRILSEKFHLRSNFTAYADPKILGAFEHLGRQTLVGELPMVLRNIETLVEAMDGQESTISAVYISAIISRYLAGALELSRKLPSEAFLKKWCSFLHQKVIPHMESRPDQSGYRILVLEVMPLICDILVHNMYDSLVKQGLTLTTVEAETDTAELKPAPCLSEGKQLMLKFSQLLAHVPNEFQQLAYLILFSTWESCGLEKSELIQDGAEMTIPREPHESWSDHLWRLWWMTTDAPDRRVVKKLMTCVTTDSPLAWQSATEILDRLARIGGFLDPKDGAARGVLKALLKLLKTLWKAEGPELELPVLSQFLRLLVLAAKKIREPIPLSLLGDIFQNILALVENEANADCIDSIQDVLRDVEYLASRTEGSDYEDATPFEAFTAILRPCIEICPTPELPSFIKTYTDLASALKLDLSHARGIGGALEVAAYETLTAAVHGDTEAADESLDPDWIFARHRALRECLIFVVLHAKLIDGHNLWEVLSPHQFTEWFPDVASPSGDDSIEQSVQVLTRIKAGKFDPATKALLHMLVADEKFEWATTVLNETESKTTASQLFIPTKIQTAAVLIATFKRIQVQWEDAEVSRKMLNSPIQIVQVSEQLRTAMSAAVQIVRKSVEVGQPNIDELMSLMTSSAMVASYLFVAWKNQLNGPDPSRLLTFWRATYLEMACLAQSMADLLDAQSILLKLIYEANVNTMERVTELELMMNSGGLIASRMCEMPVSELPVVKTAYMPAIVLPHVASITQYVTAESHIYLQTTDGRLRAVLARNLTFWGSAIKASNRQDYRVWESMQKGLTQVFEAMKWTEKNDSPSDLEQEELFSHAKRLLTETFDHWIPSQ